MSKGIWRLIVERRNLHGLLPPIAGYVYDEIFAVHRSFSMQRSTWHVTHLATGYIVGLGSTKRQAEEVVAALLLLPVPWKSKSAPVLRRYRKEICSVSLPLVQVG